MKIITIDFRKIGTTEDFYKILSTELGLQKHFGKNLDALWDVITGEIALPVTVKFMNLSLFQLEGFDKIIALFEEAADTLGNDFVFEYYVIPPQ